MTNMTSTEIDLTQWDKEMDSKTADFVKLYQQMLVASMIPNASIEIWWRLAEATFMVALNCTHDECCSPGDHGEVTIKTEEALSYAKKAIQMNAEHFMANLWVAYAAGKLALLAYDMSKRIEQVFFFNSNHIFV